MTQIEVQNGLCLELIERDNTANIIEYCSGEIDIIIPQSIEYENRKYLITTIKKRAFYFCEIRSVSFEENSVVKTIEAEAFANNDLHQISIPSSVHQIKDRCFFGCKFLRSVEFVENSELESIDQYAFADSSIQTISIPSKVNQIGEFAFYGCKKIKSIEFRIVKIRYIRLINIYLI